MSFPRSQFFAHNGPLFITPAAAVDSSVPVAAPENETPLYVRISLPPSPEPDTGDVGDLTYPSPFRYDSPTLIDPDSPVYTPASPHTGSDTPIIRTVLVPRTPTPDQGASNIVAPQPQYRVQTFVDANWMHNWMNEQGRYVQNGVQPTDRTRIDTPIPPAILPIHYPHTDIPIAGYLTAEASASTPTDAHTLTPPISTPPSTPASNLTASDHWNGPTDENGWPLGIEDDPTYTSAILNWERVTNMPHAVHGVRRFHNFDLDRDIARSRKKFSHNIERFLNADKSTQAYKKIVRETYLYNPLAAADIQLYRDLCYEEEDLLNERRKLSNRISANRWKQMYRRRLLYQAGIPRMCRQHMPEDINTTVTTFEEHLREVGYRHRLGVDSIDTWFATWQNSREDGLMAE